MNCVGVDEISVRKGHEDISVFADLVRKRVLFATEGKDHAAWLKFVEAFENHNGQRHAIAQVSMDMSLVNLSQRHSVRAGSRPDANYSARRESTSENGRVGTGAVECHPAFSQTGAGDQHS